MSQRSFAPWRKEPYCVTLRNLFQKLDELKLKELYISFWDKKNNRGPLQPGRLKSGTEKRIEKHIRDSLLGAGVEEKKQDDDEEEELDEEEEEEEEEDDDELEEGTEQAEEEDQGNGK